MVERDVPSAAALDQVAKLMNVPRGERWVFELSQRNQLEGFAYALINQGVALRRYDIPPEAVHFPKDKVAEFASVSASVRCRILVNNTVVGSGILVGPSLILTAWHVIAAGPPVPVPHVHDRIEVEFASGLRRPATPPPSYTSPCTVDEYQQRSPASDEAVAECYDLALLRLRRPVGLAMNFPTLPEPGDAYLAGAVALGHFPAGADYGIQFGRFTKLRNLRSRWGHDMTTAPGSSGAGCFNTKFKLVGIHQGSGAKTGGRLVPAQRFPTAVFDIVDADTNPQSIWSLDGSLDSPMVIGRDDFVSAYRSGRSSSSRVRGVWVRRRDLEDRSVGLGFTFEILRHLVARNPNAAALRLSFDGAARDLAAQIAGRAQSAGWGAPRAAAQAGVAETHAQVEAAEADKGRRVAQSLQETARQREQTLWIYIDEPTSPLRDAERAALEGFVSQTLLSPDLRIVIAGFETYVMPGVTFRVAAEASTPGASGLVVEYISGFRERDVFEVLRRAADAIGLDRSHVDEARIGADALAHVTPNGDGYFPPWQGAVVSDRLAASLKILALGAAG